MDKIAVTDEEINALPDNARPVIIKITFADGHEYIAINEGARSFFRKMLVGQKYEEYKSK